MNLDLQKNCNDSMKIPTYSPHHFPYYYFYYLFSSWPHLVAWRILVPQLEIEPVSHALGARSPNHWAPREVPPVVLTPHISMAHLSQFMSQHQYIFVN